ncbi:MAG: RimK family alpha-L-glutamate ligase [Desulfobacterales bacterium]|nr:RimK family alpha-L-glutamate ligase [Desulfobacterales bacterium]
MNIGILTVNDFSFHPNSRLREAAKKQGHKIILINPYDMIAGIKNNTFEYYIDSIADNLDVIMPRQGSPMGDYGLVLLRQFNKLKIPLVNDLNSITITRNQYITLQVLMSSGIAVPDTYFITKKELFMEAVNRLEGFPVIIKQVDGMGGTGVIKVNDTKNALVFLDQHLKDRKGVLVQQFLPPEKRIDIRVLVIGDKVVGAMKLEPQKDNFRANIHQKGVAQKFELPKDLEELALKAAKACGLAIAGIDLIIENDCQPVVIEANYSPGFKGLEAATGIDIALQIIDFVASTHGPHRKSGEINENI